MLTSRRNALNPLLESVDGIHLTAYLVNRGDLSDLQAQLRETIGKACEWLTPVMTQEQLQKFLEPMESLLGNTKILKHMKGNVGIFRNDHLFRVLNLPVEVDQNCVVATTFHVKPLLRWLQSDKEFLFVGLQKGSAYIYFGCQDSFKHIDTVFFLELIDDQPAERTDLSLSESRRRMWKQETMFNLLNERIARLTTHSKPKLFLAGDPSLVQTIAPQLKYPHTIKNAVSNEFNLQNLNELCRDIREILKGESQRTLERALLEFRFADEGKRTRKNIFQIAKAVVEGRVRKLIVTDELSIFGTIDRKSGGLALHPFDLDHEDDDILDDLAQMVLSQGGEVVLAKRDEIPKGRPILAILEPEGDECDQSESLPQYEEIQVRLR